MSRCALPERVLLPAVHAGIALVLLTPLVWAPDTWHPFSVGKAVYSRSLIAVTFALWVLLALARPRFRPPPTAILAALLASLAVAGLSAAFGVSPQRSLWSTYTRMEGLVDTAHWVAFAVVLMATVRTARDWDRLLNANLCVGLAVAVAALARFHAPEAGPFGLPPEARYPRVGGTTANPTFLGAYLQAVALLAAGFLVRSFCAMPEGAEPAARPAPRQVAGRARDGRPSARGAGDAREAAGRARGDRRRPPPVRGPSEPSVWPARLFRRPAASVRLTASPSEPSVWPARLFWVATALFAVYALALTGSMGALAGLGAGAGAAAALFARFGPSRRARRLGLAGLAVLGAGAAVLALVLAGRAGGSFGTGTGTGAGTEATRPAFDSILLERVTSTERIGNTLGGRLRNWEAGLEAFAERPLLGWGTGNYFVASGRHLDPFRPGKRAEITDHAHNMIIEEAATKGLAGLVAYLLLWGVTAAAIVRRARAAEPREQALAIFAGAALAGWFVQSQTLFYAPSIWLQHMLLLAFAAHLGATVPGERREMWGRLRAGLGWALGGVRGWAERLRTGLRTRLLDVRSSLRLSRVRAPWERGRLARKWAAGPPVCSSGQAARGPGKGAERRGSWERGRPARKWAAGPPVCSSGQDARGPGEGAERRGSWERGRPARKWAAGPPVCSSGQAARGPREGVERRGFPWERGRLARKWAAGPPVCSSGQAARGPREGAERRGFPWERGRPARKWAGGPPVCSSGQAARGPGESAERSGCPWDRGRPARKWVAGPPVCSSGQDARGPREGAERRGFPWERGRPARKWAAGPPVCSSGRAARGPREGAERRGSWERGRPARKWVAGPPVSSSGQDARGPREGAERSGCPWERGRPARKWAAGPPVCRSGRAARGPGESAERSGCPWERGRPARKWAAGPPVCSSGQDARGPRESAVRRGFPWERGRLARKWAAGPPVSSSGQAARGPGESVERSGCPWERGRPAGKWAAGPPVSSSGRAARGPRESAERRGCPWERGRLARKWAGGPPVGSSGRAARGPGEGTVRRGSWERGRPARKWAGGPPVCSSGQDARDPGSAPPASSDRGEASPGSASGSGGAGRLRAGSGRVLDALRGWAGRLAVLARVAVAAVAVALAGGSVVTNHAIHAGSAAIHRGETGDAFLEELERSMRAFEPLANGPRVILFNNVAANWPVLAAHHPELARRLLEWTGEEAAAALAAEPESWVIHHALARLYRAMAATHPDYAEAAQRHFDRSLALAPNLDPLEAPPGRAARR